ncbi:MAG: nickel-dependent hydrogenase large subunit, partial [Bacillota bacterium]
RKELQALTDDLKWGLDAAYETFRWVSRFDFPEFERDYEFVALRHPDEYPLNEGRIVSNKGLDIDVREYDDHFVERHVPHSNALQSSIKGRGDYLCGPLARLNLNADRLSGLAARAVKEAGAPLPWRNPFLSIVARSVEMVYAFEEALRLTASYEPPERPRVDVPDRPPRPVVGYGCTEAPRGILYHRYRIGTDGLIEAAKIVPPTAQNQASMEHDLRDLVPRLLNLSRDELTWKCEQAIRNYDPCISCATHFLTVTVDEGRDGDRTAGSPG